MSKKHNGNSKENEEQVIFAEEPLENDWEVAQVAEAAVEEIPEESPIKYSEEAIIEEPKYEKPIIEKKIGKIVVVAPSYIIIEYNGSNFHRKVNGADYRVGESFEF